MTCIYIYKYNKKRIYINLLHLYKYDRLYFAGYIVN